MPIDHHERQRSPREGRGGRLEIVIVGVVLAICSVIVGGVAWKHPTVTAASIAYSQDGHLSYTAPTSPGSVYGRAGLTTGQPIYGSVVKAVTITYTYRFQAAAQAFLQGTEQLVAVISNGQGLTQTIPIQPAPSHFTGDRFTATGTLNLAELGSASSTFNTVAGPFGTSGTYAVTISPSVTLHGRLGSAPLGATFNQPVSFNYGAGNLIPGTPSAPGVSQSPAGFASSSRGSVNLPSGKPATLLFGITVVGARVGSLAVLLASLLTLGLAGWPLLRAATSEDERARIAARYPSSIIRADAVEAHPGVVIVQLDSFDGLLQVARRLECPILHWGDAGDVYAVIDSGTLYRYRTPAFRRVGPPPGREGQGYKLVQPDLSGPGGRVAASEGQSGSTSGREVSGHAK